MTAPERQRITQAGELLHDAAAERLGEAGLVEVLRRSDEQVRQDAEATIALEEAPR